MNKKYEVRVRSVDGRDEAYLVQVQPDYAGAPHPEETILISGVSLEKARLLVAALFDLEELDQATPKQRLQQLVVTLECLSQRTYLNETWQAIMHAHACLLAHILTQLG